MSRGHRAGGSLLMRSSVKLGHQFPALLLAILAGCANSPPKQTSAACLVVAVTDGDTLTLRCTARPEQPAQAIVVRLAEIDAPEKAQPFEARSKQALAAMCFQKPATVKPQTLDRYGRTVAHIDCDGSDASAEMVRAGMAWAFTKYLTDPQIKAIEMEARAARRGLWADVEPVPPWEWRQRKSTPARRVIGYGASPRLYELDNGFAERANFLNPDCSTRRYVVWEKRAEADALFPASRQWQRVQLCGPHDFVIVRTKRDTAEKRSSSST